MMRGGTAGEIELWYSDIGVSGRGKFLKKARSLAQLRQDARNGKIRCIYARDLSRLFRDVIGQEVWFAEMSRYGCAVHVADLPDGDNPSANLTRRLLGAINQYHAENAGITIRTANASRVQAGAWVGRTRSQWDCVTIRSQRGFSSTHLPPTERYSSSSASWPAAATTTALRWNSIAFGLKDIRGQHKALKGDTGMPRLCESWSTHSSIVAGPATTIWARRRRPHSGDRTAGTACRSR